MDNNCSYYIQKGEIVLTIDDIRHAKLLILLDENKTVSKLAKRLGRPYAQVYQWIKRTPSAKTKKERTLLTRTCRDIEIKCNKLPGWMDTPDILEHDANIIGGSVLRTSDINVMGVNELINVISDLNKQSDMAKKRLTELLSTDTSLSAPNVDGQKKNTGNNHR